MTYLKIKKKVFNIGRKFVQYNIIYYFQEDLENCHKLSLLIELDWYGF